MSVNILRHDTPFTLVENVVGLTHTVIFDLGVSQLIHDLRIAYVAQFVTEVVSYTIAYSFDNVNFTRWISTNTDASHIGKIAKYYKEITVTTRYVYIKITPSVQPLGQGELRIDNMALMTFDGQPDGIDIIKPVALDIGLPEFQSYRVIGECSNDDGNNGTPIDPTSTNIVSGNVSKLGLPFEASVVAVSLGLDPQVLGSTISDAVTGDYSIDVYPHTGELLLYAAPEYGRDFQPFLAVSAGTVIHPTTPNKQVYIAQNDGVVGDVEPSWNDIGDTTSGNVVFTTEPLYRPLMNGFVKPVVTPV